jgi:type IV fimbrial biogenesis protein FimT
MGSGIVCRARWVARKYTGCRQRGLTAFELVVALGICALLATLAVPGFAGLRRSAGLSAAANELIWALHLARSSAALRGLPVTVCLTRDEHLRSSARRRRAGVAGVPARKPGGGPARFACRGASQLPSAAGRNGQRNSPGGHVLAGNEGWVHEHV